MEETVILNFEVNQTDAQKSLVQTEKNINALKKQQSELNKEYKEGKIDEDRYINSNIKLQSAIKKETEQKKTLNKLLETESNSRNAMRARVAALTKEYNNINIATDTGVKRSEQLQRELSQLSEQLNKGSKAAGNFKDNIGNYPEAVQGANNSVNKFQNNLQHLGDNVNIAGTSIGELGSKLIGFASPVTAVAGVLTGLTAAYAKSSTGANDLAFASNRLSAATGLVIEDFGRLVGGSEGGGGGKGIFSLLLSGLGDYYKLILQISTFGLINDYLDGIAEKSDRAAKAQERLNDLQISSAFAKGFAKDDERRAEIQRRSRDDEEKSLQFRLEAAEKIGPILEVSAARTKIIIEAQIKAIKESTANYDNNRTAQLEVANLTSEIKDKEEEITGKLTENVTARRNIINLIKEQNEETKALNRATQRQSTGPGTFQVGTTPGTEGETPEQIVEAQNTKAIIENQEIRVDANRRFNADILKENKRYYEKDLALKKQNAELKKKVDEAQLQSTATILGAAASLFDQQSQEYKIFATAQTLISTYAAATKAYEAAFTPPTVASPALGITYAAAAIAQGLANVANINDVGFEQGGFTPMGPRDKPVGIVHAGEYVSPQHIVNRPEARPHISALENMRVRGYADGGFVTNQNVAATQQALIMANAIKNQPPVYVSWVEGQKVGRRVQFREKTSKI